MTILMVPASVHATRSDTGQLLLLNQDTGNWHILNRSGAVFFQELRRTTDLNLATAVLTATFTNIPPCRIHQDVSRLVADLLLRGLVELPADSARCHTAVPMTMATKNVPVSRLHKAVALIALTMAVVLLRQPFRRSVKAVALLKRLLTTRDATPHEARDMANAARTVSKHYPWRIACLELSLTAVIAGALLGRRIHWCFGFAADPQAFHAWIEASGQLIPDTNDRPGEEHYRKAFSV